jgi:hypothetical protein
MVVVCALRVFDAEAKDMKNSPAQGVEYWPMIECPDRMLVHALHSGRTGAVA